MGPVAKIITPLGEVHKMYSPLEVVKITKKSKVNMFALTPVLANELLCLLLHGE